MTSRASSLTGRVTSPAVDVRPPLTLPAHDLRVLLEAFGRLGYDVGSLMAAAGLREIDFADPDARVRCEAYGTVLAQAQRERAMPNVALELARVTPLGAWPLLDYLVLTADTVGDGLHQLARYSRVTGSPIVVTVRDTSEPIRVEMAATAPIAIEYEVAIAILHLRHETGGRFAAAEICLQHTPDDAAGFGCTLGCPVRPNATWSGIAIAREAWRLPLRRRDPILRQMLEGHADAVLARMPARAGLAFEVQRAVTSRMRDGDTRIQTIARQLATSARTLQRRLAEEGVSYQELLDAARKETAARYLTESTLAIGEIAYLLGYSEPAAFHRAFRRWHETTPEAFRLARIRSRVET